MPIFDNNGKKQNVQDAHVEKYMELYPDATTIMERDGKKYRVKAKDYNTFLGDTLQTPKMESAPQPAPQVEAEPQQGFLGKVYAQATRPAADVVPQLGDDKSGYTFTAEELGIEESNGNAPATPVELQYDGTKPVIPSVTKEEGIPGIDMEAYRTNIKNGRIKGNIVSSYLARKEDEKRAAEYAEKFALPNERFLQQTQQGQTVQGAFDRAYGAAKGVYYADEAERLTKGLLDEYSTERAKRLSQVEKDVENYNSARRWAVSNPYATDAYSEVAYRSNATKLRNADELGMMEEFAKDAKKRLLADENLKTKAEENAELLGMPVERYINEVAVPIMQERMYSEWLAPQEERAKRNYNGLAAAAEGSLIGTLLGATRTDTEKYLSQVGQEAWRKNASLLGRAAAGAGSMFLDLPVFMGAGSLASVPAKALGGQVFKQLAKNETKRLVARGVAEGAAQRYANYAVRNGLKNRILLNLSTAPLQSGLTFGMFDAGKAALNMSLNGEWDWKELGKSALGGALMGGALGATGAVGGGLTHGLTGATKAAAKVAEFGVENAVFTEGGRLIGKLHGQQPENGWLEDYVESGATLLMIKAPNIAKNVSRIKGDKEASEVFAFNKLEREQFGKYGEDLNAVLESLLPKSGRLYEDGLKINEGIFTEEYRSVMSDPEVSMTTKAKLMGIVEGKVMPAPRVVDAKIEGNRVMTYDPMGRLVEVKEYATEAKANAEYKKVANAAEIESIAVMEDMYMRIKGYEADDVTVREWLAKNPTVTAEDIANIIAKNSAGEKLTEGEQRILESLRQARREGLNDVRHLNDVLAELDVDPKDVMSGIEKPIDERTEAENRAVKAYTDVLYQEIKAKVVEPFRRAEARRAEDFDTTVRLIESDRSVDETANNGMVYTTTTLSGEKIIITGGKVVLDNEGYIDVNQSEGLVAMFPDGQKKPVRPGDLREKVEVSNAEEMKAVKREEIVASAIGGPMTEPTADASQNGNLVPGAEIEVAFEGEIYKLKVDGRDERGDIILSGDGASMALPESVVQDAMKQAETLQAESGEALQTQSGKVEGENGVQSEVAPVVEGQKGENAVESSPTGEVVAFEQNIPVDEKGKKMWEQSPPEYIAEYIRVRKPEDVEAQMSVVSGMIEGLEKQKSKMDAMDAMDIDDKIAFWKKVGELIGGAKDVVDPILQLNAKHSSALTAFNSMLENIRREGNEQKAAIRYEGLENMVAELGKQLPEGYTIGVVDGKYTIVEAQPAETTPVVESAPVEEVETPQATNEMQEADLTEDVNETTLSQPSEQVGDQVTEGVGETESGEAKTENALGETDAPSLLDVVKTLYSKGKEVASKLFSMKFFDVAKTPGFMQELGLRGDKFTIKYGVIARHLGKDGSHDLSEKDWEQLPQALQNPFAISKLTDKKDSYRIYTTLQTESGEFVVVGADVKNAGREIEVNAVSTVFGRRNNANLPKNEEVIYRSKEITPEQSSLLERPNFAQYPTEQELSTDEGTTQSAKVQENVQKSDETAENGGENTAPEWLNKVPDDGRNFFVYVKFAGENKYQAIDLGKGETVDRLVRATMLQKEQLQALVDKLPSVLLEDAEFQIRDAKGNIYYNSGKVAAENEVAKQEDKEVSVATENELDIYLAEIKAVQERLKAFAQKSPRPSSFVEAYTANNDELIKRLDKQFNDALQTLVPLDIPAIEATIKGMKERKSIIKAGSANERKETPAYKAFDHIEKAIAKRKKQLEKELTEDDKRKIDIIKRGNRGELKETPQPKQENKPVESEPIKDETPVTSETTEQPETGEVADAGPVNRETLQLNMSDEDFNAMLNSGDKDAISEYLAEMDGLLRIGAGSPLDGRDAIVKEYRGLVEQYGGEENIPADVAAGINERIAPYSDLSRAIFDRKYALQDKLREIEANEAQAKEQTEKEAKAEHKKTAFGGFLAGKSDVGASTAEKALSKKYNFDGKVMTVAEFVEEAVANGNAKLSTIEEPKYKGASRAAWNRMDARQQEADAKRVKESGTKTVYTVNDHDFGKTAYDYAKFLLDKKAEQEKASQGERSKGKDADKREQSTSVLDAMPSESGLREAKTESESKQKVEKIEDVGEVLAGARKDALKVLASSFENATVKSLIELPFSKAFKKPDLKKAVESGALREEDALFYEAMFNALINSSKPKNSARHRNAVETWAEETYNSLQLIKSFVEADETARDRAMAEALEDKFPARAEELAVIEKRKVWNARNNAEWGDKTTPNPVWVAHEVLKALGYKPGDKVEIPFGVLKANVFATGYEFYNKKGERLIMQSVPTVEEGIENIVWLSKIKRGDADTMHPVSSFFATPTKRDMGDSGRYYVLWGTVRNPRRTEFGSIEEANAFAAGHKEAVVRPIQEVVKRYGYKIVFRNPLTGDKFYVNDMEFETEGEAMQYLEDNYDAVNEQTNELLAKERGEAKKEVSADDLLEVAMVRGKEGWKYAVNIKGKYANNMGMPLLLREFDTREDAKAFLNESKNEVFEIYKKQQAEQKKFVFFDTGENSRIGEDYRGGRDVTAKDFMDTFGFRGVQFGNWTNQEDRQMAVNQAFDAFMDLAKLLGVSPKALSLNGELGMAFGSRGSGFGNAHYELGEIVINLTKTRGAGSLAHEWWHALDNYFARRANVPMGMVTDSRSIDMRPELRQAYNELLKMIEKSDFYKRSKAKGDYWGRMHEVTARLMAEWVDQSLKDRGELNTFLSRGVNEDKYKRMNYDVHRAVALIKGKEALSYEEFEKTPEALAGFPYPSRAELKEFGDAMRNIFETVEEQETENGNVALFQQGMIELDRENPAFERATENVRKKLEATGVKVKVLTKEEAESELARLEELADMQKRTAPETASVQDEHQPTVVSSAGKRKSPETALPEDESSFKGTAISSDDGAKILKDIDSAIAKYENSNDRAETFIGNVAKALGIDAKDKSSKYATFEAKNGVIFTIRISNHNATVSNFDNAGEGNGISIVISRKPNEGVTNDGNAHLVEFFYPEKKISKADGKPLVEILKSIKQALYSGEYKDNTGLAVREEVNIPEFMTVFHGSGAQFDRFDHSFMGTGEGAQAYGWGTYVSEDRGVGKSYADTIGGYEFTGKKRGNVIRRLFDRYTGRQRADENTVEVAKRLLNEHGGYDAVLKEYAGLMPGGSLGKAVELIRNSDRLDWKGRHYLYTVEIPDDDGTNYLHWDRPVADEVVDGMKDALLNERGEDIAGYAALEHGMSVEEIYGRLEYALGSDKAASEFLSGLGYVGISYPAWVDGARNYVIFNEDDAQIESRIEFLRTPDGVTYGWAVNGEIYLTPEGLNPNTPIHEYTHLWAAALQKSNPKLWGEVVEAMKLSPAWNEVMADENYTDIHGDENRVASEVLSRLSGNEGYRRYMEQAEKEIAAERDIVGKVLKKGFLNRIKNAVSRFWNWLKGKLGSKAKAGDGTEAKAEPWDVFVNKSLKDFDEGVNPNVKESPLEKMVNKVDRDGNPIGDGSWRNSYKVDEVALSYPNISYKVDESASTESVYVTYTNNDPKYPENERPKVTVRYSNHDSNAVKFGDQLRGHMFDESTPVGKRMAERQTNILLTRLGLKKAVPVYGKYIPNRMVSNREIEQGIYEETDKTIQEMYDLPIGTDISQYKGKVAKGSRYLIEGDEVKRGQIKDYKFVDVSKKEPVEEYVVENNANFVSTYKTKDGKDIEYTSERTEGYGVQGYGTDSSYGGTGNSILQRQTDTGVPGANSGLNEDKGEFCVVERVFTENGAFNFTSGEKIESADDVAYIFSALEDAAKEHSFVVYVKDGKPTVIELGMGSFSATMVDIPTASLAYSRISPDHVYFVHNHPSGNLICSDQDVAMLRVFEDMSDVPVTGVIINLKTGKYGTFDTERHSVIGEKRVPENEERLTVHTLDKQIFAPDYDPMAQPLVRSSQDVAQFLNSQRMGDRPKVSFLILSRANRIIGNIHTPFTDITTDTEAVARYINERVIQFGGENAVLYGDFAISMDESRGFRLLQGAMGRFGKTKLLDVVHVEGNFTKSANDLGLLYEPETEYNVVKENGERYNSPEQDIPVESVQTQPMTFAEKITNSVLEASAKNKENLALRSDALRMYGRDVANILKLMGKQREYDKSTVDQLVKLAKMYFKDAQLLGGLTPYQVGRVMTRLNNAVGKRDITDDANELVNILVDAHNKELEKMLEKQAKTKAKKVNASGVEVIGKLDKEGQLLLEEYNTGKELDIERIDEKIIDLQNEAAEGKADEAAARIRGLELAREYREEILKKLDEIKGLEQELKSAEQDVKDGVMTKDAYKEFRRATERAIVESKLEMVDAYHGLIHGLGGDISSSAKRAKLFQQQQIDHVKEIQHNANSDLLGHPAEAQGETPDKWNGSVPRLFMSAMPTFQTMLKFFGEKAADGRGYLYERFIPQHTQASHNEYVGKTEAREKMREKLTEIFGKKTSIEKFMDMSRKDGAVLEYQEGGQKKTIDLTRGQMLYLYMINKMADGQMKLSRMGITDADVQKMANELPEEMVRFADWVQEDFLTELREKYNKVHERMFGAPMAAIESYFPIKINKRSRGEKIEPGMNAEDKPSTVTGSVIKRTKNAVAIDLSADAMQVLLGHIDDMENWAAWAEFRRDLKSLLNYRHFQNQVKGMESLRYGSGEKLWKNFVDVANIAAGSFKPSSTAADRAVRNIAKGVVSSKIAFRYFTAVKQILSTPAFWSEVDFGKMMNAYLHQKEAWDWAMKNLPGFSKRWEGRASGNEILLESDADWKVWQNRAVQWLSKEGMRANAFIDALTVATGAKAVFETKYEMFKKAGYSEERAREKALNRAAEAYNESQQSSESAYLSPLQAEATFVSSVLTAYRNSPFGYNRKMATAIANLKKKMKKGFKQESIEYMTKQLVRDGLNEEQAKKFAKSTYRRSVARDAADVALYEFFLNYVWVLGPSLIYILGGDDDEKKKELHLEAVLDGAMGGLGNLPAGETLTGAIKAIAEGDVSNFKLPQAVAMQDMETIADLMQTDPVRAAGEVLNILVAMGVGVNPQTFTDMFVALADTEDWSDPREIAMLVLRLINAPNSKLELLEADEAMENYGANIEEITREYAEYQKSKRAPLTGWLYSDESEQKTIERYEKRFKKILDERFEVVVENTDEYDMWYENSDPQMKAKLAKLRQKFLEGDKETTMEKLDSIDVTKKVLFGSGYDEVNTVYYELSTAEDEDMAMMIDAKLKELTPMMDEYKKLRGDERKAYREENLEQIQFYNRLNAHKNNVNNLKGAMKKKPEEAQEKMEKIRKIRTKAIELINNYNE